MSEVLLIAAFRNRAEALEYRTIAGEFRVAMVKTGEAYEFPPPPKNSKSWILAHCRELLQVRSWERKRSFVCGFPDSQQQVTGRAEIRRNEILWSFTTMEVSVSLCDRLLDEYWDILSSETAGSALDQGSSWTKGLFNFRFSDHDPDRS